MEIELWEGGLLQHEVDAIEKIENNFIEDKKKKGRNGSLKDQLSSIFPWKGYAGFRFVDNHKEGEFDLVIVTHCNVLIIELKDWNHGKITARGDKWFKNNQEMGRSPVSVTRNKKHTLENKLKAYKNKFSNKGRVPFIHFFVVMTGNADFKALPEVDKEYVISLADFLKFKDIEKFNKKFRPHPGAQVLNKDFHIFDQLFDRQKTAPKHIIIQGYRAEEKIFSHPKNIYKEFSAVSVSSDKNKALLRSWDFSNIKDSKAKTPEGRFTLVSREDNILSLIKTQNYDLYKYCLRFLTTPQKNDMTVQYFELYELPPSHVRFNEFIAKFCCSFTDIDRFNLVTLLFARFADLHALKIAHRDLGDHSIWISPTKEIALSSFISAYHQPLGTVGDNRAFLSVNDGVTPFGMVAKPTTTPFQADVYALAILAWHIIEAERLSPKSLEDIDIKIELKFAEKSSWYLSILTQALSQQFQDARALFDAFKQAKPKTEYNLDFDESELEPYKHNIKVSRQYPESEEGLLLETDEKEVYLSDGLVVKEWLNVNLSSHIQLGYKVLQFLTQLTKLKSLSLPYLPRIHDFGIATKTDSLFLVMDYLNDEKWGEISAGRERLNLVEKLISAVEHLHGLHIAHGDLHPDNVLVDVLNNTVSLIDIPDFSCSENKNHKYSPDNIDGCTAFERDNFAVMRLSADILGLEWGGESEEYPALSKAVLRELEDVEFGFKRLERFKDAIQSPDDDENFEFVEITVRGGDELDIYPDNGKLYLDIEKNKQNSSHVDITFKGVGGHVKLIYIPFEEKFHIGFSPRKRESISKNDIDSAKLELSFGLRVKVGDYSSLDNLTRRVKDNDALSRAIESVLNPDEDEALSDETQVKDSKTSDHKCVEHSSVATHKLWQSILETETESHPYIELLETRIPNDNKGQFILHYKSDSDPLAAFSKTDIIEALIIVKDKDHVIGEVLLKKSTLKEVYLHKLKNRVHSLAEEDIIYFRSHQDKASFTKRKNALERILAKESTISNLVDYFEPTQVKELEATCYGIDVSDTDFARYDRTDNHDNTVSLNAQQREAFQKLINYGPLSLLQGPPGTGKTEFIAAFVHYLIEKQQVNNILLVSQSHEAVNTAAERIRQHCLRLKTPLDVVRFSNREGVVSDGLKDVYSLAITTEKRELFNAESTYRVQALSQALGLQTEYLAVTTKLELSLFKQLDELINLSESLEDSSLTDEDEAKVKKAYKELKEVIQSTLNEEYTININDNDIELHDIKGYVLNILKEDYSIRPDEEKKALALAKISRDMLEVLATERVNYDEFFARSRQLVTGTCVGIGQHHIGINENQYDWVIIDEAARSIASELAIAMQSGKRILLVGDHKQLPPLYTEPHKQALARKLGLKPESSKDLLQSDFARAFESKYGAQAGAQLLTQYRMAKPIGDLVSTCFYDKELLTGNRNIPDIYIDVPKALHSTVTWLDTSKLGKASHHRSNKGYSLYNPAEADEIIHLLNDIADNDNFIRSLTQQVKEGEPAIGVICMYAEQKRWLRKKFKEQVWEDSFKALIKIDTVDSYQGKENRIIILSITRSCPELKSGFLHLPNRINVALSRAMDKLVIVGASQMWRGENKNKPFGKVIEFIESNLDNDNYQILPVTKKQQN